MENPYPHSLAKTISFGRDMDAVQQLCGEVHCELFTLNAKRLLNEASNEKILEEKCLLLKLALAQRGIKKEFSNKELCKLAHEVFEIKLLRAA